MLLRGASWQLVAQHLGLRVWGLSIRALLPGARQGIPAVPCSVLGAQAGSEATCTTVMTLPCLWRSTRQGGTRAQPPEVASPAAELLGPSLALTQLFVATKTATCDRAHLGRPAAATLAACHQQCALSAPAGLDPTCAASAGPGPALHPSPRSSTAPAVPPVPAAPSLRGLQLCQGAAEDHWMHAPLGLCGDPASSTSTCGDPPGSTCRLSIPGQAARAPAEAIWAPGCSQTWPDPADSNAAPVQPQPCGGESPMFQGGKPGPCTLEQRLCQGGVEPGLGVGPGGAGGSWAGPGPRGGSMHSGGLGGRAGRGR